jgi:hypothetical protein
MNLKLATYPPSPILERHSLGYETGHERVEDVRRGGKSVCHPPPLQAGDVSQEDRVD